MEVFVIIGAAFGLLAAGVVVGDIQYRRKILESLVKADEEWNQSLSAIQSVHNQQVESLKDFADRLGALEMVLRGK